MIHQGDSLHVLGHFPDNHFHSIITDPPYELGFMGKGWDKSGIANDVSLWQECLRVLRPGGYLLAFGGSRTYHRMACAIEDAGFEIRDSIHWVYGSGFPKSLDVSKAMDKDNNADRCIIGEVDKLQSYGQGVNFVCGGGPDKHHRMLITAPSTEDAKQWSGYGTSLKPAHEPIVVARKPLEGRVIDNVRKWGCGAINIDASRIETSDHPGVHKSFGNNLHEGYQRPWRNGSTPEYKPTPSGRFPANFILQHAPGCVRTGSKKVKVKDIQHDRHNNNHDSNCYGKYAPSVTSGYADPTGMETVDAWECVGGCPVTLLGRQSGILAKGAYPKNRNDTLNNCMSGRNYASARPERIETVSGTTSRFFLNLDPDPFFYCAKASSSERDTGLNAFPGKIPERDGEMKGTPEHGPNRQNVQKNFHPTVKPLKLIKYLLKLVTPPGGIVLDPFLGSGTLAVAAIELGYDWEGIELNSEYIEIAKARIATLPKTLSEWGIS